MIINYLNDIAKTVLKLRSIIVWNKSVNDKNY